MGRRTLRRKYEDVDLSQHFRMLEDQTPPLDAAEMFGREAPFEVEMGSGKGLFLLNASQANPDHDYLGIEMVTNYARHAAVGLRKADVTNAKMLGGDGLRLFRESLVTESVDVVHVYFPDPWWKRRHRTRRVLNEPFLNDVQRVLKPGGTLSFWTDVQEYFESTLRLIERVTTLDGPHTVQEKPADHDEDYRTHFERRTRLDNKPVYRAEYRKGNDSPMKES